MKKLFTVIGILAALIAVILAGGATTIKREQSLVLTAVDATPLDGSTTGRTYKSSDRTSAYSVVMTKDVDVVIVTIDGTGSDGDSAVFTIWGYSENGAADRIYHTVTATLGTAVADTGRTWVEQFSGTDTHITTVGIKDSAGAGNSKAKIALDTTGLKFLMFEPITFTGLTTITVHIRKYGTR